MIKKFLIVLLSISMALSLRLRQEPSSMAPTPAPSEAGAEGMPKNMIQIYRNETTGDYIVDGRNMSLYMFEQDHIGQGFTEQDFNITCTGECAENWPPAYLDSENEMWRAGEGINQSLMGKRQREDNQKWQLTFNNIPLYYYIEDKLPGETLGHNLDADGGKWWLLTPQGQPLTSPQ